MLWGAAGVRPRVSRGGGQGTYETSFIETYQGITTSDLTAGAQIRRAMSGMGQKQWGEYFRGLEKSVFRKFVDSIFFRSLKFFDSKIFRRRKIFSAEKNRKIEKNRKCRKIEKREKIELFKNREKKSTKKIGPQKIRPYFFVNKKRTKNRRRKKQKQNKIYR